MSNPNRDTQFAGFAQALIWKLAKTGFTDFGQDELTIARAAYDLVEHVMAFQQTEEYGDIDAIPDMAELPEEKEG